MSFKSVVGLDAIDVIIQLGITLAVMAGLMYTAHGEEETAVIGMAVTTTSLVVFGIRRYVALRQLAKQSVTTGEVQAERLVELESRIADLEAAQARIVELEERIDFAERLLAREPEVRKLPAAEVRQS
jgi:hypothetical protein